MLQKMRGTARKYSRREFRPSLISPRIVPALLASIGFVVTFTIRSWQADLWDPGQRADHASVGAPQPTATAQRTLTLAPWPRRTLLLPSVPVSPATPRLNVAFMPAAGSATMPADASNYLHERAREENHSSRTR